MQSLRRNQLRADSRLRAAVAARVNQRLRSLFQPPPKLHCPVKHELLAGFGNLINRLLRASSRVALVCIEFHDAHDEIQIEPLGLLMWTGPPSRLGLLSELS